MNHYMDHPSHTNELKKLNRISGQVDGIKKMIEDSRHCPDILTQLRAVRSAIRSVETTILETHLQHCVSNALKSPNKKAAENQIAELKNLFKRFD